jgi:hypothetical protein
MQRSSLSIAALATALAKAQIELANPEKSLVGTVASPDGDGSIRHFRYAPLSSGLEIVRKTLGHRARSGCRHRQSHDHTRPFIGGMDRLRLAGLSHCRN